MSIPSAKEHAEKILGRELNGSKFDFIILELCDVIEDLKERVELNRKIAIAYESDYERLQKALYRIVEWGTLGGSYSDIAAASTFQKIAREALEGK